MFGDLITPDEHTEIRKLARHEDLNRGENGMSAGNNHSSLADDVWPTPEKPEAHDFRPRRLNFGLLWC